MSSPDYGLLSGGLQICIGLREVSAAEEPAIRRKRRRMSCGEDAMPSGVNELCLATCVRAPKHEDNVALGSLQSAYDVVGELFPTATLMRAGLMRPHGERSVEQQNALPRPTFEVARRRNGRADVALYLLEYVDERRRDAHSVIDRETQSVRLASVVIRVLPEYDDFRRFERALVEGVEYQSGRRKYLTIGVLCAHEVGQSDEIVAVELGLQQFAPLWVDAYLHGGCRMVAAKVNQSCEIL